MKSDSTSKKIGGYKDHARKKVFRELWAKPLLKILSEKISKKLIYLGLPGSEAHDIKSWIEYLDAVIAFLCAEYDDAESNNLDQLLEILNDFETKGKLSDFALYNGYMEKVIMSGEDDDLNKFSQNDFVTIYNLDFCNTLTSPYRIYDRQTRETKYYYKIQAINQLLLLEQQRCAEAKGICFVMFLTVNSDFLEKDIETIKDSTVKNYVKKDLAKLSGNNKNCRLLKAYTFYQLQKNFDDHDFSMEILPPIYYQGSGGQRKNGKLVSPWLLTFTIVGAKKGTSLRRQDMAKFLENKFVWANDKTISLFKTQNIIEVDFIPSSETLFQDSATFKELWSSTE